ncbi:tetratricopeptide repeat-containing sulfotransferase family protein, partial [Thalassobaculum litoreum]
YTKVYINRGMAYKKVGDIQAAIEDFEQALEYDPKDPRALAEYCIELGLVRGLSSIDTLETALNNPLIRDTDAAHFHFALGRLYDDMQKHNIAFTHYKTANEIRADIRIKNGGCLYKRHKYKNIIEYTSPDFFAEKKNWGVSSSRPIFIVGMPRSGTTIIEQILASHSHVYGAGELDILPEISQRITSQNINLTADYVKTLADEYLMKLYIKNKEAKYVCDKMPHNFENLWLIALLFPRSVVLHCERDPMATCWSIYRSDLSGDHNYSNNLVTLGEHYLDYNTLMTHYKNVLPIEIHSIYYDKLVNDPENQICSILDICGLNYEESCFSPHQTKRPVKTASALQVTRPIYNYADNHWKYYKYYLKPLTKIIEQSEY